ncbi:hypothetical protein FRC08_011016 [Ceratobasidium sp. 394]|nr:hypothetical protein FRC08_011016 [Ceratobasidium sp. 394]
MYFSIRSAFTAAVVALAAVTSVSAVPAPLTLGCHCHREGTGEWVCVGLACPWPAVSPGKE